MAAQDNQILPPVTPPLLPDDSRTIEREMEESYLQYSMSVIISRALPDVRDGLKPVHRRILHVMNSDGLRSNTAYRKSATVVGSVMGDYHPHGDQAIYDSMVRLAQEFSTRYLLVDGQGNFGSMDGDPPAAMRYTEARMTKLSEEMLVDIDKETVDWRPNYDGRKQEPTVLPAKLPNLLLNGQLGIAVGMATNIPPHNLNEVLDAVIELIDNPEATLDDLLRHVKGPDFPTGGTVYGGESMRAAYGTGKGGVIIRAAAEVTDDDPKRKSQIIITEMPYAVNKAGLIEKIAELVKNKKITTISDIRDESSRGNVRVVIDLKKDAYPKKVLNQLYKLTPLQTAFHYNMLALVDGIQPRVLGLEDILKEYLKHRQSVVRRRTEFELKKAEERAHILEGLSIALDHIEAVIKTIRASQTTDEARQNLIKQFKLSELQANAILAMQLRQLAGLERQRIADELAELVKLIKELKAILGDERRILGLIKDELEELKERFGDERRTKIIAQELGKFSEEELIPNEQVVVTLTAENYVKRNLVSEYRKQGRGGKGKRGITTKEEDLIAELVFANTHDQLLFFTNRGRVFRLKAYEVPQVGLSAKGVAIVNLLQLQPDEFVTSMIRLDKDAKKEAEGYLFMSTKQGTVKKTPLAHYQNIRTSGLIAIRLDDQDELKWIRLTTGDDEIIISTARGQSIRFHERDVRPMGRTARGVRGIRLRKEDEVIDMNTVVPGSYIFVISENGYGKRTSIDQFTPHRRGGVGIKSAVVNNKTGQLVGVRTLTDDSDEIIIISRLGQTIRLGLKNISAMSRTTQGVRVMRLNAGDNVAAMALVKADDELAEDAEEAAAKPAKTAVGGKTAAKKPKTPAEAKTPAKTKATKAKTNKGGQRRRTKK